MFLTYLIIAIIILSLLLVILSILALRNIRSNANFSTNAKLKSANNWIIGVIASSILSLFFSIGILILLRSNNNFRSNTLNFLTALLILATFILLIFIIISIANYYTILELIIAILGFLLFVCSVLLYLRFRKLPLRPIPILNSNCEMPAPAKSYYIVSTDIQTLRNLS